MSKFFAKLFIFLFAFTLSLSFSFTFISPVHAADDISIRNTFLNSAEGTVNSDPNSLIKNGVNTVFVVAAAIVFAYLVWGAISWITSGGDKSKVEVARNRITSAVIGLLVLVSVWAIFNLVITVAFGSNDVTLKSLNDSSGNSQNNDSTDTNSGRLKSGGSDALL